MYVRGQNFGLMGLLGLGEFPGTQYVGRNAAEVRAMEPCLTRGGRCRVLPRGSTLEPPYFAETGFCPGGRDVQCVSSATSASDPTGFDFFSWFRSPSTPATAAAANAPGSGSSVFTRPGGSAPPGMPGPGTTGGSNVNPPPAVDPGIIRSYSAPFTEMSTTGKVVVGAIGAVALIALGVAIFKKPKATPAATANRRRRRNTSRRAYEAAGGVYRVMVTAPTGDPGSGTTSSTVTREVGPLARAYGGSFSGMGAGNRIRGRKATVSYWFFGTRRDAAGFERAAKDAGWMAEVKRGSAV